MVGLWARFNTFNATSSGIEIFDATAKNVYGNGNANTLDFTGLTILLNSPLGTGKGLRIYAEAGNDNISGSPLADEIRGWLALAQPIQLGVCRYNQ